MAGFWAPVHRHLPWKICLGTFASYTDECLRDVLISLVIKVFREILYLDSLIGGSCCAIVTFPILAGAKNMISYTGGVLRYVGVVSRFHCMYPDIS